MHFVPQQEGAAPTDFLSPSWQPYYSILFNTTKLGQCKFDAYEASNGVRRYLKKITMTARDMSVEPTIQKSIDDGDMTITALLNLSYFNHAYYVERDSHTSMYPKHFMGDWIDPGINDAKEQFKNKMDKSLG